MNTITSFVNDVFIWFIIYLFQFFYPYEKHAYIFTNLLKVWSYIEFFVLFLIWCFFLFRCLIFVLLVSYFWTCFSSLYLMICWLLILIYFSPVLFLPWLLFFNLCLIFDLVSHFPFKISSLIADKVILFC